MSSVSVAAIVIALIAFIPQGLAENNGASHESHALLQEHESAVLKRNVDPADRQLLDGKIFPALRRLASKDEKISQAAHDEIAGILGGKDQKLAQLAYFALQTYGHHLDHPEATFFGPHNKTGPQMNDRIAKLLALVDPDWRDLFRKIHKHLSENPDIRVQAQGFAEIMREMKKHQKEIEDLEGQSRRTIDVEELAQIEGKRTEIYRAALKAAGFTPEKGSFEPGSRGGFVKKGGLRMRVLAVGTYFNVLSDDWMGNEPSYPVDLTKVLTPLQQSRWKLDPSLTQLSLPIYRMQAGIRDDEVEVSMNDYFNDDSIEHFLQMSFPRRAADIGKAAKQAKKEDEEVFIRKILTIPFSKS